MANRIFLFLVISFCIFPVAYFFIQEKEGINIPLRRHKTAREEFLNAPNLSKYGISFEDLNKKHHHSNRTNDSIALYRYLDNEFYGEIVIGHPGQKLKVAFDTAWGLSWVLSSKCNYWKTIGCWFHNKYDHTKSSEYKKDGRPYTGNEGAYSISGFYSYDNISVAHSNVTNQSFVEMVDVPYTFLLNKADGILGLGIKSDDYDPFFYTLLKQKKIKNPLFSIYLNRDRQSKHGGNVMLGFIEHRHIHKDIHKVEDQIKYLPVQPGKYWQFQMDKIVLDTLVPNSKDNNVFCPNGCKTIVDTSSNAIVGPASDIKAINDVLKAKAFVLNRYTINCETVNKLPRFAFVLGGQNFNLSGPDYVSKMSIGPTTFCVSAFQPDDSNMEEDIWILGGAFLSQYYSIYNIYEKKIGFVKSA